MLTINFLSRILLTLYALYITQNVSKRERERKTLTSPLGSQAVNFSVVVVAAAETDCKWLEVEVGLEEEFEEDSFEDIQVGDKHHLHCILVSDNLDIWFTWNHTYTCNVRTQNKKTKTKFNHYATWHKLQLTNKITIKGLIAIGTIL